VGQLPRVHFAGRPPWPRYAQMLHVSTLHPHLSVPSVLSWSLTKAMAAGCAILASDTAPVPEAIEHGEPGVPVDARDPAAVAGRAAAMLADRARPAPLRPRARQAALERFSLSRCLPARTRLLRQHFIAGAATEDGVTEVVGGNGDMLALQGWGRAVGPQAQAVLLDGAPRALPPGAAGTHRAGCGRYRRASAGDAAAAGPPPASGRASALSRIRCDAWRYAPVPQP
jgi:hypothetical protein